MPRQRRYLLSSAVVMALAAVLAVGLLDLQAIAAAQPAKLPQELRKITAGDVTAHFGGKREARDASAPLEYSVTHLWFTFKGDQRRYVFAPKGELFFSDWQFDIFSPNGDYVLLLQDRFGPYHVVDVSALKTYPQGKAEPDLILSGKAPGGSPDSNVAGVHHDARWVSPDTFEFKFSCCGQTWTQGGFIKDFPLSTGAPPR